MATWLDLKSYIGAQDIDDLIVSSSWAAADALVTAYIGGAVVPDEVSDRARLEVGSELYNRKNAPNGIAQFDTFGAAPIRVARDPLVGVYPLLRLFMKPGIA